MVYNKNERSYNTIISERGIQKSDFPENIAGSARKHLQIANRTSHTFTIHTCVPDANVH